MSLKDPLGCSELTEFSFCTRGGSSSGLWWGSLGLLALTSTMTSINHKPKIWVIFGANCPFAPISEHCPNFRSSLRLCLGDSCPGGTVDLLGQCSRETVVQGDSCPRGTVVQGDNCPPRQIPGWLLSGGQMSQHGSMIGSTINSWQSDSLSTPEITARRFSSITPTKFLL